jgi:flagellar biosynthetic protein FliQ
MGGTWSWVRWCGVFSRIEPFAEQEADGQVSTAEEDRVTPEIVTELGRQALETTLLVSSPILGLSLFIGLAVSAFQAMTQLNEATLTFVPKVVALFVALLFFLPWMLNVMTTYMANLLMSIPNYIN